MQKNITPEQRLDILRASDGERQWDSLNDKRACVVCERIFKGRDVQIRRDQRGRYLLHCPTEDCCSVVGHWIHVHAPVARMDGMRDGFGHGSAA
jgi:hypothetical protein